MLEEAGMRLGECEVADDGGNPTLGDSEGVILSV